MNLPEEGVYAVACPDCGRPPGNPCVYLAVPGVDLRFLHYRTAKVQARAKLTGTPTKRPHNGRHNVARAAQHQRQQAEAATRRRQVAQETRSIARAMFEFDRREAEQLRAWLSAHGNILLRHPKKWTVNE